MVRCCDTARKDNCRRMFRGEIALMGLSFVDGFVERCFFLVELKARDDCI